MLGSLRRERNGMYGHESSPSPRAAGQLRGLWVVFAVALATAGVAEAAPAADVARATRAGREPVPAGVFVGHGARAARAGARLERSGRGRVVHRVEGATGAVVARLRRGAAAQPVRLAAHTERLALARVRPSDARALVQALSRVRSAGTGHREGDALEMPRHIAASRRAAATAGARAPARRTGSEATSAVGASDSVAAPVAPGGERRPGWYDTSELLTGGVAVNVVFVSSASSDRDFSSEDRAAGLADVIEAMDMWATSLPDADLSFRYRTWHVATERTAIEQASSDRKHWIADAMSQVLGRPIAPGAHYEATYELNNRSREELDTDWAYTCFLVKGGQSMRDVWRTIRHGAEGRFMFQNGRGAFAMLGGPYMVFPYGRVLGLHFWNPPIIAHELGHIFHARDEYASYADDGHDWTERSGYFDAQNGNLKQDGAPSDVACIMRGSGGAVFDYVVDHLLEVITLGLAPEWSRNICCHTRHQMGHRDADGDGLPDHVDVTPELYLTPRLIRTRRGTLLLAASGSALVGARPNRNPYAGTVHPADERRDLNLDLLRRVRYRVEGGPWRTHANTGGRPGALLSLRAAPTDAGRYVTLTVEVTTRAGKRRTRTWHLRVPPEPQTTLRGG
jgi:hypothetical protein